MQVVHLIPALFDRDDGVVGGAERYALELARHVAEHTPTSLIAFGKRDREFTVGKLRVRTIGKPLYVRGQQSNPVSLSLLSEIGRAAVVHCHQQHIVASSLAAVWSRMTRRKVFVSDLGGGGWDISSYISTDRWYHGHLHISEYSRSVFGHLNKPWAHVIYGGVDTEKFSPATEVRRTGSVLYVGRVMPHKGIDDLIRAVTPDMPLRILGQPYHAGYMADLKRLAAGKNVTFEHNASDEALLQAYRESLCLVLPSVYRTMYGEESRVPELLGQTLLEGMSCGTPAICTQVASMPEVVEDGVTGYVVPPNSPEKLRARLIELREDPALAARLGQAGRRRVLERFAWPVVARRCLNIYAQ